MIRTLSIQNHWHHVMGTICLMNFFIVHVSVARHCKTMQNPEIERSADHLEKLRQKLLHRVSVDYPRSLPPVPYHEHFLDPSTVDNARQGQYTRVSHSNPLCCPHHRQIVPSWAFL
ncbi:hypothetical protein AcW1_003138 [Taiwanofungus camphoratus]|nr:hypothetical protein AcV5_001670 [Antrodia cinnamomea]KAI0933210.1 hypothetical protein AcV7_004745 [Antrodia cinnamomea]KAI0942536.1 hypothetical protein AcW1_003138 [Antrodia cinnamomea]